MNEKIEALAKKGNSSGSPFCDGIRHAINILVPEIERLEFMVTWLAESAAYYSGASGEGGCPYPDGECPRGVYGICPHDTDEEVAECWIERARKASEEV